jgi:hypothetical protein
VLTAAKAVEDKLDEEIAALDRLDPDDIEALRERRIQQMRRAAERRAKWRALGHGEYTDVPEKEFFSAAKASERLVCHFYRDNWPCKVRDLSLNYLRCGLAWFACGSRGELYHVANRICTALSCDLGRVISDHPVVVLVLCVSHVAESWKITSAGFSDSSSIIKI